MTTLLERLDAQLATCTDPLKRAELMAEKGGYLARMGCREEVEVILLKLRRDYGRGDVVRISLHIMILEGIQQYFSSLDENAIDRFRRAAVIGLAVRELDLLGLATAWRAHLHFERCEFELLRNSLDELQRFGSSISPSAKLRVSMVIADALRYVGWNRQSQEWYDLSRAVALQLGDRVSIGALMYNRVAFGFARLCAHALFEDLKPERRNLEMMQVEAASARSFQDGTHTFALTHLTELCQARIQVELECWADALVRLQAVAGLITEHENRRNRPILTADIALCRLMLGDSEQARTVLRQVGSLDVSSLDVDERLLVLGRMQRIASTLGEVEDLSLIFRQFEQARSDYAAEVKRITDAVGCFASLRDWNFDSTS